MPRPRRLLFPGDSYHVYDRGNNRQRIFLDDKDCTMFMGRAFKYAEECKVQIHTWVIMPNHFHFFVTPLTHKGLSHFMQYLKAAYGYHFNSRYKRTGTIWESRYCSLPVQSTRYALHIYRYIELNPVRAGLVRGPRKYHWSSYHTNARGVPSGGLTPHPAYTMLGIDEDERLHNYRELVREAGGAAKSMYEAQVHLINTAQKHLAAYGDEEFHNELCARTGLKYWHLQKVLDTCTEEGADTEMLKLAQQVVKGMI